MEVGVIGLLVLVADVYAILKIVNSSATDAKKAIWIAVVLIFPIVGVIAWYLLGPGR